jgi:hypothetical protein
LFQIRVSAIKIAGGYVWGDVYAVANKENVVVVEGGDPVSILLVNSLIYQLIIVQGIECIGGWAYGGGHSAVSRDHQLRADQILEAQVVPASGKIVTANACQNSDLFSAILGGGGGTYGIVVSTTVKAYPSTPIVAQVLAMAPLTDEIIPEFMDAVTILYGAFPALNDGSYSGHGSWNVQNYAPVFANFTTGYQHALAVFNQSLAAAEALFALTAAKLAPYNGTSLFISTSYLSFPSYASYYAALSGGQSAVGTNAALGSRFLDKAALNGSATALKKALNVPAGFPGQFTSNNVCLVSGGQVFKDASDPNSGVNPSWRTSYVHHIIARGWTPGTDLATQTAIHNHITYTKVGALRNALQILEGT